MPTSPYSIDLREKVIKFIIGGNSQTEAARVFTLNLSTVNRWYYAIGRKVIVILENVLGQEAK